jgi:hypothetical protein
VGVFNLTNGGNTMPRFYYTYQAKELQGYEGVIEADTIAEANERAGSHDFDESVAATYDFETVDRSQPQFSHEEADPEPKTAIELKRFYGLMGEHPLHIIGTWMAEVTDNGTQLGYWEWVSHKLEETS